MEQKDKAPSMIQGKKKKNDTWHWKNGVEKL